jgi:hypothetical protein
MSSFARWVQDTLDTLKITNKDLATAFHDEHTKIVGKANRLSWETIEPKVSKLLSGDEEGERFFFKDEERAKALAKALRVSAKELRSAHETSVAKTTLVLDPRLDKKVSDFLVKQSETPSSRYVCVQVSPLENDFRTPLRDAAKKEHDAWVVYADYRDIEFFKGADVRTTGYDKVPRGFALDELPDLVEIPPPAPPRLFDDDGTPMVPIDGLRKLFLDMKTDFHSRGQSPIEELLRKAAAAESEGETATFRLPDVGNAVEQAMADGHARLSVGKPSEISLAVLEEKAVLEGRDNWDRKVVKTHFWTDAREVFAIGALRKHLETICAPHHKLNCPPWFEMLKKSFESVNPWPFVVADTADRNRDEIATLNEPLELLRSLKEKTGVAFDQAAKEWCSKRYHAVPEIREKAVTVVPVNEKEAAKNRKGLAGLLKRDFAIKPSQDYVLWTLRVAAEAPLMAFPTNAPTTLHVVADLGAGNAVRIMIEEYKRSPAQTITVVNTSSGQPELDGGDIHVWLWFDHHFALEGSTWPGLLNRRKREEEDRERRARYDDDDDD